MSAEPIAVAVVGLGRWGLNYCRTLLRLSECRLVAAVDVVPSARERAVRILGESFGPLLSDVVTPDASAVVVATPEHNHFDVAREQLAAGRDVLVEKPMAGTVQEADHLCELARRLALVLAVGHTSVYGPGFSRLHAAGPGTMEAVRTSAGPRCRARERDAVLRDLAPHDLALAVLLAGRPCRARVAHRFEDSCEYEVDFENGHRLCGRVAWELPALRRFRVSGSSGTVVSDEPVNGTLPFEDLPLTSQCRDFMMACRNRTTPLSDGAVGRAVTGALVALATSDGDWVELT